MSFRDPVNPLVCEFCNKHPKGHNVYECRASLAKQLKESRELLTMWAGMALKNGWKDTGSGLLEWWP